MIAQLNDAWGKLSDKLANSLDTIILLLPNLAISICIAIIGIIAIRFIQRKLEHFLKLHLENTTMSYIMSKIIAFVLMVGLLFLILGVLNLDKLLTSLLATAGVLGLAIGLALQEPLANAFSGIMLSVKERFNVGDLVSTNDYFGTIKEVNLKSTIINTLDGPIVTIPNKLVFQNPLVNYSYSGVRRVEVECGISYGENLDKVEQIALKALEEIKRIEDRNIEFFYTRFGDSSINFKVRFWIREEGQAIFLQTTSDALKRIKAAFDQNNILIPFPIRTLDFGIKGGQSLAHEIHAAGYTGMKNEGLSSQ